MVQYFHLTSIFTANLSLSLLTICVSLFLTSSFISGLHYSSLSFLHTSSTQLYSILVISDLLWSGLDWLVVFSPLFRRFFWDLCSSLWLQRNCLQRRSPMGKDAVQAVQKHCSLLCFLKIVPSFEQLGGVFKLWSHFLLTLLLLVSFSFNIFSCSLSLFQDVDTIYHSQDNREFNLLDFSHLDSRWHCLLTS